MNVAIPAFEIAGSIWAPLGSSKNKKQQQIKSHLTSLTATELKYLLQLISKSDFKGADLQIIFSITAKLQNQLKSE